MMRLAVRFSLLPAVAVVLSAGRVAIPELTGDQILARFAAAEEARDKELHGFKVTRTYRLEAGKKSREAGATAEFQYLNPDGKTYRVVEETGSSGLFREALHKVMQAEVKASKSEEDSAVTPRNYTAVLAGMDVRDGRPCYVLELTPKKKSKYLLNGKAWIVAAEFALLRIEGRPSESVSFWVGKPFIVQTFSRVGQHWLLAENRSTADVKIIGRIELTIQSSGYTLKPTLLEASANSILNGRRPGDGAADPPRRKADR